MKGLIFSSKDLVGAVCASRQTGLWRAGVDRAISVHLRRRAMTADIPPHLDRDC